MLFKMLAKILRLGRAAERRLGHHLATRLHRAQLAQVGPNTRFQMGVHFDRPQQVKIGSNCYFARGIGVAAEGGAGSLNMHDRVQINRDVHLDMTGGLTLGADVLISEGAVVYTHDHGLDPRSDPTVQPKTIGQGAWIGMRAVILPGCRSIGPGAIIGAGAIVTADVPAGAIVAGNPARVIGQRQKVGFAA